MSPLRGTDVVVAGDLNSVDEEPIEAVRVCAKRLCSSVAGCDDECDVVGCLQCPGVATHAAGIGAIATFAHPVMVPTCCVDVTGHGLGEPTALARAGVGLCVSHGVMTRACRRLGCATAAIGSIGAGSPSAKGWARATSMESQPATAPCRARSPGSPPVWLSPAALPSPPPSRQGDAAQARDDALLPVVALATMPRPFGSDLLTTSAVVTSTD
jgi:hypothetical protein